MRLDWVLLLILLQPIIANASAGNWEFKSSVDEFTDEKKASAMVDAAGGVRNGFIHVACFPSGIEVKISAGKYIGDKAIDDNVKYRVDKNEFVVTTMEPTSKSYVYMNDKNSQFLKDLMHGKKVVIQLTSYDYDTSTASFSLNGAETAISKVLALCNDKE